MDRRDIVQLVLDEMMDDDRLKARIADLETCSTSGLARRVAELEIELKASRAEARVLRTNAENAALALNNNRLV
tara:strand:- start:185 stop:406 length:222 start_codon:yes stop_codon:yes gene_type:complete